MEKTTQFFKGDPALAKLFGPIKEADLKVMTDEEKKKWLKRRDAARKSPPPYALVQKPEVYK